MLATLLLLICAAYTARYWWRSTHPETLHGCPLCIERVRDVADHLTAAHHGAGYECGSCGKYISAERAEVHWRLWHAPRPKGPEDRQEKRA